MAYACTMEVSTSLLRHILLAHATSMFADQCAADRELCAAGTRLTDEGAMHRGAHACTTPPAAVRMLLMLKCTFSSTSACKNLKASFDLPEEPECRASSGSHS